MLNRAVIAVAILGAVCTAQIRATRRTPRESIGIGQVKKDPKADLKEQRKATAKRIAEARAKLIRKKWGEARRILDRARMFAAEKSQANSIRSLYQQIDREGQRQVAAGREAYRKGNFLEALDSFERISKTFGWLGSGVAAGEAIKRAEKDPSAQGAIQESKAAGLNKLVERILKTYHRKAGGAAAPSTRPSTSPTRTELIKNLPLPKQSRAVDLLTRISETYPTCPTGKRAAGELEQLYADEVFIEKLKAFRAVRKARAALRKAEMYRSAGMLDKAVQSYQRVIRDFPGTEQAAAAKLELSLLTHEAQ